MMLFNEQIARIKEKLVKAREADKGLNVFGANGHKYELNPPATEEAVAAFEKRYGILLPDCYKAFILQVGNGGSSYLNAGAGPFYGIYPLGEELCQLPYDTEKYLKNDCLLSPHMPPEYWQDLTSDDVLDKLSDEEYDVAIGRVFGGVLPIGPQGCTYLHGIIVNGEYRGRVVNLDQSQQQPQFTFERNFLDWYERWLNEVISGELQADGASSFGYSIGGTEAELLTGYLANRGSDQQHAYLDGMLDKRKVSVDTLTQLEAAYVESQDHSRRTLLHIIAKSDYKRAKPHLAKLTGTDLLTLFQLVFWYEKDDNKRDWLAIIEANINDIEDAEALRFCTYLLQHSNSDYGPLIIPFASKNDLNMRCNALSALGMLPNKHVYIDTFIAGLHDTSNHVIGYALRALSGIRDKRLLPHYRALLEQFSDGPDNMLSILDETLNEWGLNRKTIFLH